MLTMYSTRWCGHCRRLGRLLDGEGIAYETVDIEQEPDAAEYVASVDNGNRTVPTVRFPDGSALVNPSLVQIKELLATLDPDPR